MIVYVWRGYGDVDVYAADTSEQLVKLFEEITGALGGFSVDEQIEKCSYYIQGHINDPAQIRKSIRYLIEEIVGLGTHEIFEYGSGFETIKNL